MKSYRDKEEQCSICYGHGKVEKTCSRCFGSGNSNGESCYICYGRGRVEETCSSCGGRGTKTVREEYYEDDPPSSSSYSSPSSGGSSSRSGGGGSSEYDRVNSQITNAVYMAQRGDLDGAIAAYKRVIEYCKPRISYGGSIKGQMHLAYFNMGLAYKRKGDWDSAIVNYKNGIGASSVSSGVEEYLALGEAYLEKEDYDNAIEYYTKSINAREGNITTSYNNRGFCYARKGNEEQAIADFKKSADWGSVYGGENKDKGLQNLKNRGIDYTPETPPEIIQERQERASSSSSSSSYYSGGYSDPFGVILSIIISAVGAAFSAAYLGGFLEKFIPFNATIVEIAVFVLVFIVCMIICRSEKSWKIIKLAVVCTACIAIGILGNKAMAKIKGGTPTASTVITQHADITSNVNFRKGPSTNDEVIRQLKQGDTVTLTGETSGGWTQITHNGDTGWVSTEFLRKYGQTETPKAEVQTQTQAAATSFPPEFVGTWKRSNYGNTITFTANTLTSSSQYYSWNFSRVSGNNYTIRSDNSGTAEISIRLTNGNIEISGDSGGGEDNWNGTWVKQ